MLESGFCSRVKRTAKPKQPKPVKSDSKNGHFYTHKPKRILTEKK